MMFVALLNVGVSQIFLLWFENSMAKTPPGQNSPGHWNFIQGRLFISLNYISSKN